MECGVDDVMSSCWDTHSAPSSDDSDLPPAIDPSLCLTPGFEPAVWDAPSQQQQQQSVLGDGIFFAFDRPLMPPPPRPPRQATKRRGQMPLAIRLLRDYIRDGAYDPSEVQYNEARGVIIVHRPSVIMRRILDGRVQKRHKKRTPGVDRWLSYYYLRRSAPSWFANELPAQLSQTRPLVLELKRGPALDAWNNALD